MGYEIRLIVGNLGCSVKDEPSYFLRVAELDLCKCGYDSEIHKMGTSINQRNNPIPKYSNIKAVKVAWSNQFKVDQENVVKDIFGECSSGRKKEHIIELLGGDRDAVENNVDDLSELFQDWESKVDTDCYGNELFAIPLPVVLDAIKRDNAKELLENGETYRRFDVAIALLESLLKAFPHREIEEGGHDFNLYCVLWGH